MNDPIFIGIRVFQDDEQLWRFRVEWWIGNVDLRSAPPTGYHESFRGWRMRITAQRRAADYAHTIGAPR